MRASQFATGLKYRPDIDGLRAVAIVPVVLFHFGISPFAGGFVGVDVFFVISGYLITSLVAAEITDGTFSLVRFYERRVRRIFPALFAMLAIVTVAACVLLFPFDLVYYAKSLCATALFAANFEFWRETGYFDVLSNQKPLIHLWSIAVEEQFYLLFPALLLLIGTRRRVRLASVIGILFASLCFSIWAAMHAKAAGFYLLPSRAWELMAGAVLALGGIPTIRSRFWREAAGILGIALIGYAIIALSPETPFPGAYALLPCAGAALVIHSGRGDETVVRKVLALRPLVFIGLISYSLYLWHWPIYVLARYVLFRDLSLAERCVLIAVSFLLATLSWHFVEQPLRRPVRRRLLFPAAVTGMAAAFSCGAFAITSDGLPQRLSPRLQQILAEQDDHEPRIDHCFALTADDVKNGRMCTIGAPGGSPRFLLWGDSHADAILPAVAGTARSAGRTGLFAGGASCVPLLGVTTPASTCKPFNDAVEKVAFGPNIEEVILEARWAKYADGEPFGDEPHGHLALTDSQSQDPLPPDNHGVFERGLERTVRALTSAGKKVVLVASVPEIGWPVPAVLARRALAGEDLDDVAPGMDVYLLRQRFVLQAFARMQKLYGVTVIYPQQALCSNGRCNVAVNGVPLYRDEHHLSVYGALKLQPLLAGIL